MEILKFCVRNGGYKAVGSLQTLPFLIIG